MLSIFDRSSDRCGQIVVNNWYGMGLPRMVGTNADGPFDHKKFSLKDIPIHRPSLKHHTFC